MGLGTLPSRSLKRPKSALLMSRVASLPCSILYALRILNSTISCSLPPRLRLSSTQHPCNTSEIITIASFLVSVWEDLDFMVHNRPSLNSRGEKWTQRISQRDVGCAEPCQYLWSLLLIVSYCTPEQRKTVLVPAHVLVFLTSKHFLSRNSSSGCYPDLISHFFSVQYPVIHLVF